MLLKYRNHNTLLGFYIENYEFDVLLRSLTPKSIVLLISAMVLERKILLVKRRVNDTALLMQALIGLMRPFNWHFTIVTYLTKEMSDYLDAPVPFLVGVSTLTWMHICESQDLSQEIFVFDVE